jgi:hypothetical protein
MIMGMKTPSWNVRVEKSIIGHHWSLVETCWINGKGETWRGIIKDGWALTERGAKHQAEKARKARAKAWR